MPSQKVTVRAVTELIIKRLIAIPQTRFNGIVHFGDDACIARHTTSFSPARLSETLTLFDRMADLRWFSDPDSIRQRQRQLYRWKMDKRFSVDDTPNEPNRFGWVGGNRSIWLFFRKIIRTSVLI
ncbi:hypothetical protein MOP99_22090 [Escherichia coli]|nr:hypothetical protein [Escherichia coli]MCR1083971.1 hypothetical protein [Escherichia coli]